jgi:FtsZ-binding cell division protein ZapB
MEINNELLLQQIRIVMDEHTTLRDDNIELMNTNRIIMKDLKNDVNGNVDMVLMNHELTESKEENNMLKDENTTLKDENTTLKEDMSSYKKEYQKASRREQLAKNTNTQLRIEIKNLKKTISSVASSS